MFVLRGLEGQIVTSAAWDGTEKEEQHETYGQAQQALEEIEKSTSKGLFRIVALDCERCGGDHDVMIFHVGDESKAFCLNCRVEMFAKKSPVGRPSVGVTKKVSLTLPEDEWEWVDKKAEGNRSQYFREIVRSKMQKELRENYEAHIKTFDNDDVVESDFCPKCGSDIKIVHEVEALGLNIYDVSPAEIDPNEEEITHIECGDCGTKYVNISY